MKYLKNGLIAKSWMKYAVIIGLSLMTSSNALAGQMVGEIDQVLIYEPQGQSYGLVYVYPVGGVQNPPSCHGGNGDYYSFRTDRLLAKEYYSGLLAAMLAGTRVDIWGEGDCIDQGASETLKYFRVRRPGS